MDSVERIDKISFEHLSVMFFGIIIGFGILYFSLTIYLPDHGIVSNSKQINLLNSIYFSMVTITSLGYGDIIPIGFSQMLAVTEVIFGLFIFGLILSKIVSVRQQKIINNMYSNLQIMHLRTYRDRLRELRKEIRTLSRGSDIYIQEIFLEYIPILL